MSDEPVIKTKGWRVDQVHLLSPKQVCIAALIAQGYPNRDIASRLHLREQSVRNEVSRIFKKTGIANRVQLALRVHGLQVALKV